MPSPSQSRRNASQPAVPPVPPVPPAAPMGDDFLSQLQAQAAAWQRPTAEQTKAESAPAIAWPSDVLSLRETLTPVFRLPPSPFGPRGIVLPYGALPVVSGMELGEILALPVPKTAAKAKESTSLMLQTIHGRLGDFPLPASMADGQELHLSVFLAIFNGRSRLYEGTKYFQSLQLLVAAIARLSNRYCLFNPATFSLSITAEPFKAG